ncbi:MAG TPA: hypothetical protein VMT53_06635 [Terriglobales bacterium]|nr:hypothetical protein [Terriglobales bacterium]
MTKPTGRPTPGQNVKLRALPAGFLDGLPQEDQKAILNVVGKRILLTRYEEDGRAELAFRDAEGDLHTIYVEPNYIE